MFGTLFEVHVPPESPDVKSPAVDVIAASLLPSAEELTLHQLFDGTKCETQLVPEFTEV